MKLDSIRKASALPTGTTLQGYRLLEAVGQTATSIVYLACHELLDVLVYVHEFFAPEYMKRDSATGAWAVLPGHEAEAMQALQTFVNDMRFVSGLHVEGILPVRHAFALEELSIQSAI